MQYARDAERYMFQRLSEPINGTIDGHGREPHMGARIRQLNVFAEHFAAIKANRKFINDPIPRLYLAAHLYTHTWPTEHPGRRAEITVTPAETARLLRSQFGIGSADDVRHALELLAEAGQAADNGDGTWNVSSKPPRIQGERDLAQVLATKAATMPRPIVGPNRQRTIPAPEQGTLF